MATVLLHLVTKMLRCLPLIIAIPIRMNISISMGFLPTYSDIEYAGMLVTIKSHCKIKPRHIGNDKKHKTSNNKHNM